jgi:ESCRT-II complex subunit VPS25
MPPKFAWPAVYNFPPFWTLQEVQNTKRRQRDLWCELIMKYMRFLNKEELVVAEALEWDLFKNATLNRSLKPDVARLFLDELVKGQNAQWTDTTHEKLRMIFRKPGEWAMLLLKWARDNSFTNMVLTFYELREGTDTMDQPFHMLDLEVMKAAVVFLVDNKQAVFLQRDNLEDCGVKFL